VQNDQYRRIDNDPPRENWMSCGRRLFSHIKTPATMMLSGGILGLVNGLAVSIPTTIYGCHKNPIDCASINTAEMVAWIAVMTLSTLVGAGLLPTFTSSVSAGCYASVINKGPVLETVIKATSIAVGFGSMTEAVGGILRKKFPDSFQNDSQIQAVQSLWLS